MKKLNKKMNKVTRFEKIVYPNVCCSISSTVHHINVNGQEF